MPLNLKRSIIVGAIAGMAWGWVSMMVNAVTKAFPFEYSFLHNLITFATGGAIFGIVTSGFLSLLEVWLPFKRGISKAVYIATTIWVILFLCGYLLATVNPERYAFEINQAIQGLILAVVFGLFLGILWDKFGKG